MALSKETLIPYWPKNMFDTVVEKTSASTGTALVAHAFTPGTLVVEISGKIVACDTDTTSHKTLPAYMVWTDGSTRQDILEYELDGTVVEQYTCLAGKFKADLHADLFTSTPQAGFVIMRSATAGKLNVVSLADYTTLLGTSAGNDLLVVGRVEGAGRKKGLSASFWNCSLDLG